MYQENQNAIKKEVVLCQGYFWGVLKGPIFGPVPNDFFPILKKNPNLQKKIFFVEDWDFHSVTTHTHTSYMVNFSFNLMAIVCVVANLFFH